MRMMFLASTLLLTFGCGDDGGGDDTFVGGPCKKSFRPVVMVHGFLAAADTWTAFARRFEANGYCASALYALDWNSLTREGALEALGALVDRALAESGQDQVNLIGHSAGGGLSYQYLAVPENAAKVATYAHVASQTAPLPEVAPAPAGPADAPVTTLNLKSAGDTVVEPGEIPGAINIVLNDEDHYQAASSDKAFEDVYAFFNGGKRPKTSDLANAPPFDETQPRIIEGKAQTIGENTPAAGWAIKIYEVDGATGARKEAFPKATFTAAEDGSWGPFEALPGVYYELQLSGPAETDKTVHYYREPFAADDHFVRLRSLPGVGSLVGALFAVMPFGTEHTNLIALSESQAVVAGRDVLTVGSETLSTDALASAERTSIAFFLFDEDADQASGGEVQSFKNITPVFLTAIDRYLPAGAASIPLTFNGRTLNVPSLPSSPDGAIVATFD